MRRTVCLILTLAPSALLAQQFHNGSFTEGKYPEGEVLVKIDSKSHILSGWTVTHDVDWVGSYWPASDGKRSIDLSGEHAGSISQTFSTKTGVTYRVTFDLAANPDGAPDVKKMRVTATGGAAMNYTVAIAGHNKANMGWTAKVYTFRASKAKSKLTFASLTNTECGPAICHVQVTALPAATPHGGGGHRK